MQVIITEVQRQAVYSIMNCIAQFNGWDVKYPGLDWIIPTTILKTTDTGSSVEETTTDAVKKPKEKSKKKEDDIE